MTSLVLTSQIRFEVIRRAGKTLMDIFLDYTCCTHRVQSICNISEFVNGKTQPQFENIYRGGVTVFGMRIFETLKCHISFNF